MITPLNIERRKYEKVFITTFFRDIGTIITCYSCYEKNRTEKNSEHVLYLTSFPSDVDPFEILKKLCKQTIEEEEYKKLHTHALMYAHCKECPCCSKNFDLEIHSPIKFLCGFRCCLECFKTKESVSCFICREVGTQEFINEEIYKAEEVIRAQKN